MTCKIFRTNKHFIPTPRVTLISPNRGPLSRLGRNNADVTYYILITHRANRAQHVCQSMSTSTVWQPTGPSREHEPLIRYQSKPVSTGHLSSLRQQADRRCYEIATQPTAAGILPVFHFFFSPGWWSFAECTNTRDRILAVDHIFGFFSRPQA